MREGRLVAMFQGPGPHQKLASETVVVEAPFSLTGSTKRLLRGTERWNRIVRVVVLVVLLPVVWSFIVLWYLMWGIWLIPYRLIRRSSRTRKRQELQHREMLNQMNYQAMATHAAIAHQTAALQGQQSAPPIPPPPAPEAAPPAVEPGQR
jgi:hypothetical protein